MKTAPRFQQAGWFATLWTRLMAIRGEVLRFGMVGLVAFVVDVGLFNLLRYAGEGVLFEKPLTAKIISVGVATTVSFFLNRSWTYSDRGRNSVSREYVTFFVVNGIAMFIAVLCLWFSHYILGLTSPLADNISANFVGLALGTLFRFWAYRTFVFPEPTTEPEVLERVPATTGN